MCRLLPTVTSQRDWLLELGFTVPFPRYDHRPIISLCVQWDLINLVGDLVGGHIRLTLSPYSSPPFPFLTKRISFFWYIVYINIYFFNFLTSAWSYWHMSDENSMRTANFSWLSWVNSEVWSFWSCPFMVGSIPLQSEIHGVGVRGIIKVCSSFSIG